MPTLVRPDGIELHWEEDGSGPTMMLCPYWSGYPGVFERLLSELAHEHRVVTWDARGTGTSTRSGPYDIETDSGDLEALLEQVGGGVSLISIADGVNKACRVGAERPDLVSVVIAMGAGPFSRSHFKGEEGMLGSDAVVNAFLEMLERDYRGALRSLLAATNSQMSEEELRERVGVQSSYCPQDAAGAWLPSAEERRRLIETHMPEARLEETGPGTGPVSNPDLVAGRIREIIAEAAHSA